ncbi:uncharacterized protein LOC136026963 [Artemia franciscana]|uniref:Chitin-binding type-2 domain-containing protein n=2 Tax=Artemia franciscana TaxID=6661 RepID=A0AA88L6K7_ARTSF|nr:hypothetical protein QYM36_013515 [Artemia franciscana]
MIVWVFYILTLSISVFAKEPECPFGTGKTLLADTEKCNIYWECDDGLLTDLRCRNGLGFNPAARVCTSDAPCLRRPAGSNNNNIAGPGIIGGLSEGPFGGIVKSITRSIVSSSFSKNGRNGNDALEQPPVDKNFQQITREISSIFNPFLRLLREVRF